MVGVLHVSLRGGIVEGGQGRGGPTELLLLLRGGENVPAVVLVGDINGHGN